RVCWRFWSYGIGRRPSNFGYDRRRGALMGRRSGRLPRLFGCNDQGMTVPRALEILAPHIEDHTVVMRVPDADLISSGARTSCQNYSIGIFPENEQLAEAPSLQPLPIKPSTFRLEPTLIGEFNQA